MSARDIAVDAARTALRRMKMADPSKYEAILTRMFDGVIASAEKAERDECAADAELHSPAAAEVIRARGSK